jgi:hypothetical protein
MVLVGYRIPSYNLENQSLRVPSIVRLAGGTRRSEDKPNTSLVNAV